MSLYVWLCSFVRVFLTLHTFREVSKVKNVVGFGWCWQQVYTHSMVDFNSSIHNAARCLLHRCGKLSKESTQNCLQTCTYKNSQCAARVELGTVIFLSLKCLKATMDSSSIDQYLPAQAHWKNTKLKKTTYLYESLQFLVEMNTRGSKTLTNFVPFHTRFTWPELW